MKLRVKIITVFAVAILCFSPFFTRVALANWYSWYSSGSNYYYGVWATIYTPSSAPNTASGDHTSHSVTTQAGDTWLQAGWLYYPSQAAQRYYEYSVSGNHDVVTVGNQNWGTGVKYEVGQYEDPSLERWCAWIAGVQQDCFNDIASVPTTVLIQSEDHTDPEETVFYTIFQSIRVRNSAGTWVTPTLEGYLHANPPYGITKLAGDKFLTWRHGIFLPMIKK